ncbi:U2 snRNP component IST3 [Plectosphaerella cucumerina]|uniref:U2 snRNP component IST3 n=1 Tax=Plectosphaerella cucumerina TaxID=40658 RepID=A0A8K0TUE4_9PEZI|nr:U2 snRNP component IST3 [Plectosphaerella cucumerina]
MNQIRAIQALNQKEIENGISPEASWHTDYRDTAFINFGGLPYDMSEGDVITIFSQYGEPVWLKLVRDKETGKSKGFGWLKYEDQRSTDLAVDNLGGATIGSRLVRVDHARYKFHDDEDPDEGKVDWETITKRERGTEDQTDEDEEDDEDAEDRRPTLPEERELALIIRDHDEDDPMKSFLIDEKKKEVEDAIRRYEKAAKRKKEKERHGHSHRHRSHRSRRHDSDEDMRDADADVRDKRYRSRRDRDGASSNRDLEQDSRKERRRDDSRTRDSHRHRDERRRDRSRDGKDRKADSEDERRRERRHERSSRREKGDEDEDRYRRRRDDDRHRDSRRRSRSRSGSPRPRR